MPESIEWSFRVQVKGGPSIMAGNSLAADAYEKLQVTLAPGDADREVTLATAPSLLLVSADRYTDSDPTHKLSYKLNNAGDAIDLPSPLILLGRPAVDTFATGLTSLSFSNSLSQAVTIQILTARDATP